VSDVTGAVARLRAQLDDFVSDENVVELDDEAWWEQLGDLLDFVYVERALARRAAREVVRCPALYHGTTRCVRTQEHLGNHFSPSTGQWKNERVTSTETATHDTPRCEETYNPGAWPYTSRCVLPTGHGPDHRDRNGKWVPYGRDVSCPRCIAYPGEPCRDTAGQKTATHPERVRSSAQHRAES
jgi:hypothetical protein